MKNVILSALAATVLTAAAAAAPALAAQSSDAAQDASETLHTGVWKKKTSKSSGEWSIVKEHGRTFVKLSDDFKTRKAPDLKIFLSPLSAAAANGKNATEGAVLISALSSHKGAQIYEIPAGVDLAAYKSILIHCEAYAKLWSAADLT